MRESLQKRDSEAKGCVDRFNRIMNMKFLPDRIKVVVDSVLAHVKLRGNFLIQQPLCLKFKNLHLSRCQGTIPLGRQTRFSVRAGFGAPVCVCFLAIAVLSSISAAEIEIKRPPRAAVSHRS